MPALVWKEDFALQIPAMDATHREFIDLLAETEAALARSRAEGLRSYDVLVQHTVEHFGREDRWMAATGFAAENCHSGHHAQILQILHEVARLAREQDDWGPLERVLPELALWFPSHADSMDAALASHLQQVGFNPDTDQMARPPQLAEAIHGCGGACGPHDTADQAC